MQEPADSQEGGSNANCSSQRLESARPESLVWGSSSISLRTTEPVGRPSNFLRPGGYRLSLRSRLGYFAPPEANDRPAARGPHHPRAKSSEQALFLLIVDAHISSASAGGRRWAPADRPERCSAALPPPEGPGRIAR